MAHCVAVTLFAMVAEAAPRANTIQTSTFCWAINIHDVWFAGLSWICMTIFFIWLVSRLRPNVNWHTRRFLEVGETHPWRQVWCQCGLRDHALHYAAEHTHTDRFWSTVVLYQLSQNSRVSLASYLDSMEIIFTKTALLGRKDEAAARKQKDW